MSITSDLYNIRVRFERDDLERLNVEAMLAERSLAAHIRWIVKRHLASPPVEFEFQAPPKDAA